MQFRRETSAEDSCEEIDRNLLSRAAQRTKCGDLSIAALAEVIKDALKAQRRELITHLMRLHRLAEAKRAGQDSGEQRNEKTRVSNIHRRLVVVEAELRKLRKGRGWS
jgi:hypothetical protein